MKLPQKITLEQCEPFIDKVVNPELFIPITNVLPVDSAETDSLVFIASKAKNKDSLLYSTEAKTVITDFKGKLPENKCILFSNNPKLTFARIINSIYQDELEGYIDPTAIIHPEAVIHPEAIIGPYCVIGKSKIGARTRLYPNVVIYDNVVIGEDGVIDSGAVIGSAGFGFVRDENNLPVPFPQLGGVKIGNHVEIGANVCVDRGALKDTIIHDYVKIDNRSQISHNNEIGPGTLIMGTTLAGSVKTGENCHIAGLWVMNQKQIGNDVTLGGGSVALSSLHDGKTYMGYPAMPLEKYQTIQYKLKKL